MKKALLILLLIIPYFSEACTCIGKESIEEAYKSADLVISGEIVSIEEIVSKVEYDIDWTLYEVVIKTNESFKNGLNSLIKIFTGTGGGDCGYVFKEGENYIIYANLYVINRENEYMTDDCMRTILVSDSSNEIQELRKLKINTLD